MDTPFPFEALLAFGTMSVFLILGIFLRAKIRFFQKFLIPSCLIGGAIGMIILNINARPDIQLLPYRSADFEVFVYHLFIVSFISIGLTHNGDVDEEKKKAGPLMKGATWLAMIEGVTISLQSIVGSLLVVLFGILGVKLFPTFGLFVPLGFTEGPGQALSFGKAWEGYGFENAATIGVTFAAIGFLVAFFIGIPLIRWGVNRGLPTEKPRALPEDILKGLVSKNAVKEKAGHLTTHSGNVDTLAYHVALIGIIYVLTWFFSLGLVRIIPGNITKALFGFFFFFGLAVALGVRLIMKKLGIMHMIDPGTQRRITGWAVDFLLVATLMSVQFNVVVRYIIPILVMTIAGILVTVFPILYLGRRVDRYNFERTMIIFGTCTGTVSTGLILLRVIDPEFRTPVALEIGFMNVVVVPIIVASMILVNAPVWWDWNLWLVILAHLPILIISLLVIRVLKMWGTPKF